jgi:Tol biopolymer transport system component
MQSIQRGLIALAILVFQSCVHAQSVNRLVSTDASGQPPAAQPGDSSEPALAQNGRLVVFSSTAAYLVANDDNASSDIFLRDMLTQTTTRLGIGLGGAEPNDDSVGPVISEDGRYVAFLSWASNLVAGIDDGHRHVYLLDRLSGQISLEDRNSDGTPASYNATPPMAISPNGRFLAFASFSSDLVDDDTNGRQDIFVRNVQAGTTLRASLSGSGTQISSDAEQPAISDDGRFVAFVTSAPELGGSGDSDVFLRDMQQHATILVSQAVGAGIGDSTRPRMSADGRRIAFRTPYRYDPDNHGPVNSYDIYVYDRIASSWTWASPHGIDSADVWDSFALSADGRFVAYEGVFTDQGGGAWELVYRHDLLSGQTIAVTQANAGGTTHLIYANTPAIASHGNAIAFVSDESTVVPGAGNGSDLVYHWGPTNLADLDHIFMDGFDPP